MSKRTASIEFP